MSIMSDEDKSLIIAPQIKKAKTEDIKQEQTSPEGFFILMKDVRDHVMNDLLGGLMHKAMIRSRRALPVKIKVPIMRVLYNNLFKNDLLVDPAAIKALFGGWCRKTYRVDSYALLCGPIVFSQDVISSTSTNLCLSFHYKVYNGAGVLQWPDEE